MLKIALATLIAIPAFASGAPRAVDGGLMVEVPNYGLSRVETVDFCLDQVGVKRYQDLATDLEFDGFEVCMHENT